MMRDSVDDVYITPLYLKIQVLPPVIPQVLSETAAAGDGCLAAVLVCRLAGTPLPTVWHRFHKYVDYVNVTVYK
jgi:hypothetical protein